MGELAEYFLPLSSARSSISTAVTHSEQLHLALVLTHKILLLRDVRGFNILYLRLASDNETWSMVGKMSASKLLVFLLMLLGAK